MKMFAVTCNIYMESSKTFGGNQRFVLESVSFSLLHIINELYVDWTGAFRFPVKSLTVLPSTGHECRCRVGGFLMFNGVFPHLSSVGSTQTAQATGLYALEIHVFEYIQFNSVL